MTNQSDTLEINLSLETPRFICPRTNDDLYFRWMSLLSEVDQFQRETFSKCSLESTIKHLMEECQEYLENPNDRMEAADVTMLAFRVMNLLCADPENLVATRKKLAINKARAWETDAEGNVRHFKGGER